MRADLLPHLVRFLEVLPRTLWLAGELVQLAQVGNGKGGRLVQAETATLVLYGLLEERGGLFETAFRKQGNGAVVESREGVGMRVAKFHLECHEFVSIKLRVRSLRVGTFGLKLGR